LKISDFRRIKQFPASLYTLREFERKEAVPHSRLWVRRRIGAQGRGSTPELPVGVLNPLPACQSRHQTFQTCDVVRRRRQSKQPVHPLQARIRPVQRTDGTDHERFTSLLWTDGYAVGDGTPKFHS